MYMYDPPTKGVFNTVEGIESRNNFHKNHDKMHEQFIYFRFLLLFVLYFVTRKYVIIIGVFHLQSSKKPSTCLITVAMAKSNSIK